MSAIAQQNPGLGSDLSCIPGVPNPTMRETSGRQCLVEDIIRRLSTPRGGLLDDPNYGYDVSHEVNDDLGPLDIARIRAGIAAECVKDQRVISAKCDVTFAGGALVVVIGLTDSNGPFSLTLAVSSVTVALLRVA